MFPLAQGLQQLVLDADEVTLAQSRGIEQLIDQCQGLRQILRQGADGDEGVVIPGTDGDGGAQTLQLFAQLLTTQALCPLAYQQGGEIGQSGLLGGLHPAPSRQGDRQGDRRDLAIATAPHLNPIGQLRLPQGRNGSHQGRPTLRYPTAIEVVGHGPQRRSRFLPVGHQLALGGLIIRLSKLPLTLPLGNDAQPEGWLMSDVLLIGV